MFGKVNLLLLAVFSAILGVQFFWKWDAPGADNAPTAQSRAAAPGEYAATTGFAWFDTAAAQPIATATAAEAQTAADHAAAMRTAQTDALPPEALLTETQKAAEATPTAAPAQKGLLVTYAETLGIRFHGYTEISGAYRVNDDDTVSIPVIDRVSVAGLTAAELETVLAQKVFELTGRRSDVTIEVERYQPVFVSGLVNQAGSFPWRRNMTVLHAVALSGGLYRSPDRQRTGVGIIDAKLVLDQSFAELKRAITRAARLQAERDKIEFIAIPERLVALVGKDQAQDLIEKEQSLMLGARSAAALEIDAIEASLRAARDEIIRLKELSDTLEAKIEERGAFIKRMTELEERGYVTEERMSELRTSLIDLEANLATVRVNITRAEAARLALERDRIGLLQTRSAELNEELVAMEATIAEKQLAYDAAQARRAEFAAGRDAAAIAASQEPDAVSYSIVRRTKDGIKTIAASPFEELLPGDVVVVDTRKGLLDEARAPVAQSVASSE